MSELLVSASGEDVAVEMFELPETEAKPPRRRRKMTAEEAAFELARGPFVGRLAAQETLLEFAEQSEDVPDYAVEELQLRQVHFADQLAAFEANWRYEPQEPVKTNQPEAEIPPHPLRQPSVRVAPKIDRAPQPTTPRREKVPKYLKQYAQPEADVDDEAWQKRGLCSQSFPDLFSPDKGESPKEAKRICLSGCVVREICLKYALDNDIQFGVWGGLTARERRKFKKRAV